MVNIGDFLSNLIRETRRGTCKACGKSVQWSQKPLASHKRFSCSPALTNEERQMFQDTEEQDISDFLSNFVQDSNSGSCKACGKSVHWSQRGLSAHKRSNRCSASTSEATMLTDGMNNRKPDQVAAHEIKGTKDLIKTEQCDENSTSLPGNYFNNFIEIPSVSAIDKDNCYICNEKLTSCRNKLTTKTKLTQTALYEVLESLLGTEISDDARNDSFACHECLVSLHQLDKWQYKSSELQKRISSMFNEKPAHQIIIKEEPGTTRTLLLSLEEPMREPEVKDDASHIESSSNGELTSDSDEDCWPEEPNTKRQRISEKISERAIKQNPSPSEGENVCVTCSKRIRNPSLMEIHQLTDHERSTGPFHCPKCSKRCKDLHYLKIHYLNHSRPRSVLCNVCGATFPSHHNLETHLRKHDDIRPYSCTIPGCSKRFPNNSALNRHLRVHSGEKAYECPFCPGKKFARRYGMDVHIKKKHSKQTKQKSDKEESKICGIRFNSKHKLKLHTKSAHQVKPQDYSEKTENSTSTDSN